MNLIRTASLVGALALITCPAVAEDPQSARQLLDSIVEKMERRQVSGEMPANDLTIEVLNGTVTVTGRVESATEASQILASILSVDGVSGIQLNIGIARHPSPRSPWFGSPYSHIGADPDTLRRPISWDDGHWQLDWDPAKHPAIHRTKR